MKPITISNFVTYADPDLLDLAYKGRHILRVLDVCLFDRASTIAHMAKQPKKKTRKMLEKLAEAGLVYTDEDSDPDGKILWGTLPTDENFPDDINHFKVILKSPSHR